MVAIIVTCNKRRFIMNSILVSELKCFKGLDSIIASAVKHLENLGYRHGTIGKFRYIWKEFAQFARENSEEKTFSTDLRLSIP